LSSFPYNWDLMLADNFQGKWWDNNTGHNGNQEAYGDLWPKHASPFDSHQLQQIDEREEELLKRLEGRMEELEELDKEINHCWGRATEIHKLLGFPGTTLQP
ncbi:hypothetical protein PAXRUDRAFT_171692, partial [Paxillus rubicundulus Ve08.2h10]